MTKKKIKNKIKNKEIIEEEVEVEIKAEVEVEIKINQEAQDLEDLILVIVDLKEGLNILNLVNK